MKRELYQEPVDLIEMKTHDILVVEKNEASCIEIMKVPGE